MEAAYLKGKFLDGEVLYARPPPRYRNHVQGIPVVWRLLVPLYGEADAGRIWNRTLVHQLVHVQHFRQSEYDPCYFWKLLADGTRLDVVMYCTSMTGTLWTLTPRLPMPSWTSLTTPLRSPSNPRASFWATT